MVMTRWQRFRLSKISKFSKFSKITRVVVMNDVNKDIEGRLLLEPNKYGIRVIAVPITYSLVMT